MTTIIHQVHAAIKLNRVDVIEFIISQDYLNDKLINIAKDKYILDYVSVSNCSKTVMSAIRTLVAIDTNAMKIINSIMQKQCSVGNNNVVKDLISIVYKSSKKNVIDIHYDNELFFRTACEYGQLTTAKILLDSSKTAINKTALDYYAFRQACNNNHVDTAKWLYNLCDNNIVHKVLTDVYNISKQKNNQEIVNWLLTIQQSRSVELNTYELASIQTCIEFYNKHYGVLPENSSDDYTDAGSQNIPIIIPNITQLANKCNIM